MKKRTMLQIVLGAIMAMCMGAGVSCALSGPLEKPEQVILDDLEILSWEEVPHADGYCVTLNDKVYETQTNNMDLFDKMIEPGTTYQISVHAHNKRHTEQSESVVLTYEVPDNQGIFDYSVMQYDEPIIQIKGLAEKNFSGKLIIPETIDGMRVSRLSMTRLVEHNTITGLYISSDMHVYNTIGCEENHSIKRVRYSSNENLCGLTNCTALERIDLPGQIEFIDDYAFWGCTNLKNFTIPDGVERIEKNAFTNCTGLTKLEVPASVEKIDGGFVGGCTNLQELTVDEKNPIYKSEGNCILTKDSTCLVVGYENSTIPTYVKEIGDYAFTNSNVEEVKIHEGLKKIGVGAFYGCKRLTTVYMPEGLESIGGMAFGGCYNLLGAVIPHTVMNIDGAFSYVDVFIEHSIISPYPKGWRFESGRLITCSYAYDGLYPYVNSYTYFYGTGANNSMLSTYISIPDNFPVVAPKREGYVFKGWSKEENGEIWFAPKEVAGQQLRVEDYNGSGFSFYRDGYLGGLTKEQFKSIPNGTTIYAVWEKIEEKNEG